MLSSSKIFSEYPLIEDTISPILLNPDIVIHNTTNRLEGLCFLDNDEVQPLPTRMHNHKILYELIELLHYEICQHLLQYI